MPTYVVIYQYTDDTAVRDQHRPEHRAFLRALHEQGTLLLSGPFTDEEAGGLLILRGDGTAEDVLAILDDDPFRREGVIADRRIRPWDLVIGAVEGAS